MEQVTEKRVIVPIQISCPECNILHTVELELQDMSESFGQELMNMFSEITETEPPKNYCFGGAASCPKCECENMVTLSVIAKKVNSKNKASALRD